jgi:Flp pilus assembly pilin Flp
MFKVLAFLTAPARRDDRGVTAVEYALLLVMLGTILVVALGFFGQHLGGVFSSFSTQFLDI